MRLIILIALAAAVQTTAMGCQLVNPTVPVEVTIRDAETKAPVPAAEVTFLYPTDDSASHSRNSSGKTNTSGTAEVFAAADESAVPQVKVTAANYLAVETPLQGDALRSIRSAGPFWFLSGKHEKIEVAMYVYRGPVPVVELCVAKNHRGLVKVDVRVREDVAYEPGQRVFKAMVPQDGLVQLDGPAILRNDKGPVFFAHYPDDTRIPRGDEAKDDEVAFRWLHAEGRTEVFVIGTKGDWESFRRAGDKNPANDSGKSGGKGGGGGGRRGGGGGGGS